MNNRLLKLFILLFLILTTHTFANRKHAEAPIPFFFRAHETDYNRKVHQVLYVGDVHMHHGPEQLQGDHVIVFIDPKTDRTQKLIAYGKPVHYSTIPQGQKDRLYASADEIIYFAENDTALLIGNAVIHQTGRRITGPRIHYNFKRGTLISNPHQAPQKTVITIPPANTKKR